MRLLLLLCGNLLPYQLMPFFEYGIEHGILRKVGSRFCFVDDRLRVLLTQRRGRAVGTLPRAFQVAEPRGAVRRRL